MFERNFNLQEDSLAMEVEEMIRAM
jgi:hypothetical protein